jgi:uncharacterized membrane protein YedE/YeeE
VVLATSSLASLVLDVPYGLPASTFTMVCAPVAGISGFLIGSRLSRKRTLETTRRRNVVLVLLLCLTVISIFSYEGIMDVASPSLLSNFFLYLLFSSIFFSLYMVMGIAGVNFIGEVAQNRRAPPLGEGS